MRWLFLALGILTELGASTCMKLSNGFTNISATILTFIFWGISLSIFMYALKHFDLSFAYAVWAGLGILLVSLLGILYFKEPTSLMKIAAIVMIVGGVVMLNVSEYLLKKN